jgi:hypothetical protein
MSNLITNDKDLHSRLSFALDFGFSIMLFGYEIEVAFDLFEWHLKSSETLPVFMYLWFGPFYFGVTDSTIRVLDFDEKDANIAQLCKDLKATSIRLLQEEKEKEQLRGQLAGCSVAAGGYGEKLDPGAYGHSNSYDEVRLLHVKYMQALKLIEKIRGKKEPKRTPKVRKVK